MTEPNSANWFSPEQFDSGSAPYATQTTRARPLNFVHLIVLLICWFPLNPMLIFVALSPNASIHWSAQTLLGMVSMICGPLAPPLFEQHAEIDGRLLLIAAVILVCGVLTQFLWRPSSKRLEVVRQIVWAIGWWVWLCGAFVAYCNLM